MTASAHPAARLRLRLLRNGDFALFSRLYTDAQTMRYIAPAWSRDQALASFHATLAAMRRPRAVRFFTIVDTSVSRAIGLCSIQPIARRERAAELGIMLAPGARGRRIGYAAMRLLAGKVFQTLSIDTIWVQYHPANVAAARLFAGLGFVVRAGVPPRTATPEQCVRFMHRSTWHATSNQPSGEQPMSNIIGILENIGGDAALRHATREQLLQAMQNEQLSPAQCAAILGGSRAAIDSMLGTRDMLYCSNFPAKPPKKAPGKQPSKVPPKKAPPKKPAKIQARSRGADGSDARGFSPQ